MSSKRSCGYSCILKEVSISPSKPLFADVMILLRDSLVTNGKEETSLMTKILLKMRSGKQLCGGAMSWELDHDW